MSRQCSFCEKTNSNHHPLLCPKFKTFKKSSSNVAKKAMLNNKEGDQSPTLLFTSYVKSSKGRIGSLIDNGSTDNYVLNEAVKKMKLKGNPVELLTEGFGGNVTKISTAEYQVPIEDKEGKIYYLPCYGTDVITSDNNLPDEESYKEMCREFGINPNQVVRPKKIELLISMREQHLHPKVKRSIEGMSLAEGPLGKYSVEPAVD